MSKKTNPCNFRINNELAPLLDGMESMNWNTYISKNNVKTITEPQKHAAVKAL